MEEQRKKESELADREIVNTRVFNFSREILFSAYSDPDQLSKWWGPKGFTNTFIEFDFRPGGNWDFVMHGPDGIDYHNKSVFVEIVEHEKIVFDHLEPIHSFRVTVTFEKQKEKTLVTFQMLFNDPEECAKVKSFVYDANEENFDRLEAPLSKIFLNPSS